MPNGFDLEGEIKKIERKLTILKKKIQKRKDKTEKIRKKEMYCKYNTTGIYFNQTYFLYICTIYTT